MRCGSGGKPGRLSGGSGSAPEKGADTQASKEEAGAEAGAEEKKEEGGAAASGEKLIIYSPLTESMIDSMLAMFEEDTGIDAECLAMGTGDALKRIQTEADNPQADPLILQHVWQPSWWW